MASEDMLPFIFGGNAEAPTYEELKRRRAIAAALASRQKGAPKNLGEGLTYLGESIGEAVGDWRMRQMEQATREYERGRLGTVPPATPVPPVGGPRSTGATPAARPVPAAKATLDSSLSIPGSDPLIPSGRFGSIPGSIESYGGDGFAPSGRPSVTTDVAPVYNADSPAPAPAPTSAPAPVTWQTPSPEVQATLDEDQTSIAPPYQQAALPEIPGAAKDALRAEMLAKNDTVVRDRIAQALVSPQHEANRAGAMTEQAALPPARQASFAPPEPTATPQPPPSVAEPIERRTLAPQGWTARDARWQALSPDQKAAAMAMMEANPGPDAGTDRANVLAAIHNRADREGVDVGSHVSRSIYQPTIEPSQQARLDRILRDPAHAELTALSQQYGQGGERPHTATHFLAPEQTMLALEAQNPAKYRSWRSWTGYNPETGYSGVQLRDSSHAFLSPDGGGGGGGRPPAAPQGPPVTTLAVRPSPMMDEQPAVPQQAAAPATPEDTAQDRILREVALGGGRPSLLGRGATASRGDIASDAQPLGRLGTIGSTSPSLDADVAARRNAITDALVNQQQQPPAPVVPDPDPTVAGPTTVPASPTTGSERPVQLAQAGQLDPSMFSPNPIGGGITPAPGPRTANDAIKPAPVPQLPSQDQIPPQYTPAKDPGEFKPEQMTPREKALRQLYADPRISDPRKVVIEKEIAELEQDRRKLEERRWNEYTTQRGEFLKNDERALETQVKRLAIEEQQHKAALRPVEAAKARADLENARADLEKKYYDRGIPRDQAAAKARLEIEQATRTLNKPDTASVGGTELHRPYAPPGQPQQPYAVPPGLPAPKEDMTETQAKATTFLIRTAPDMDRVDREMKGGKALTNFMDAQIDALGPLGSGNMAISDDYRRARDSLGNWGAAFLTHVSGAAVSPSEALRNLPAFIPRPGDNDRDIAEKSERRRAMTEAIASGAGKVGMDKIYAANDAYEYRKNGEHPPTKVTSPEQAASLPPGTWIEKPDGTQGRVPPRKR